VIDLEDFSQFIKERGAEDDGEWRPSSVEWIAYIDSLSVPRNGVAPEILIMPDGDDWGMILSSHPNEISVVIQSGRNTIVSWNRNGEEIVAENISGVDEGFVRLSQLCKEAGLKTIPLHLVHQQMVRTYLDSRTTEKPKRARWHRIIFFWK